jgi:hypothetical protein
VDLLRQEAGNRRNPRWWDRGMWLCVVALGMIGLFLGGWAVGTVLNGRSVVGVVQSCHTTFHFTGHAGRSQTTCMVLPPGQAAPIEVDTSGLRTTGANVNLVKVGSSYSERHLDEAQTAFAPAGLACLAFAWWMGWPPRKPQGDRKTGKWRPRMPSPGLHRYRPTHLRED